MKSNTYDVIVVGAGPSGSICARNLARAGYHVLLCEKRPVVGVPVRCGEATGPSKRVSDFTTIDEAFVETRFSGVVFHGPAGIDIRYDAQREIGIMLDRRLFDQHLAREAVAEGADLQTNARVSGVSHVENGKRLVTIEKQGEGGGQTFAVTTSMVVGADGAESLIGRASGLKTRQMPPRTCTAIELRIRAQDPNPDCLTFWSGQDSVSNGYVWAFPKVKSGVVNLGSGELIPKMGAKSMYDLSVEFRDRYYPGAEIEEVHGGCVPVGGHLDHYVMDRLALCGDAAHHTDPLTGGGILPGLVGGEKLAAWIDKGFKTGNLSESFLQGYQDDCWQFNGRHHAKEANMRDFVLGLPARDQEKFYRILKGMVEGMVNGKPTLGSSIVGYSKLSVMAARNFKLARKTVLAKVK